MAAVPSWSIRWSNTTATRPENLNALRESLAEEVQCRPYVRADHDNLVIYWSFVVNHFTVSLYKERKENNKVKEGRIWVRNTTLFATSTSSPRDWCAVLLFRAQSTALALVSAFLTAPVFTTWPQNSATTSEVNGFVKETQRNIRHFQTAPIQVCNYISKMIRPLIDLLNYPLLYFL